MISRDERAYAAILALACALSYWTGIWAAPIGSFLALELIWLSQARRRKTPRDLPNEAPSLP